jgi:hypothetical protein
VRSFALVLALGSILTACAQKKGERCWENDDCNGSLVCCACGSAAGTCQGACGPCQDLGTPEDMGGDESSMDMSSDPAMDPSGDPALDMSTDPAMDMSQDADMDV